MGPLDMPDFEAMSLHQLLPFWSKILWWNGVRPMQERMLKTDLSMAESMVLHSLQYGQLTVAQVADCMFVSHSAASRALDRLVHEGLVARQENPEDRRQKQLTLAPAGEALIEQFEAILSKGVEPLIGTLTAEEQEQLRRLITRMLVAQVRQMGDGAGACPWAMRDGYAPSTADTEDAAQPKLV